MAKDKEKASDRAERLLIERILTGDYLPRSALPGERDLAKEIGVARPALREALQRLARDGWLVIQQGKPTEVSDYLRDGSLTVLTGLLQVDPTLVPSFVPDLIDMWALLSPAYTYAAIQNDPRAVRQQVYGYRGLADRPRPYARAQWRLHRRLIEASGNTVFLLIFNTFWEFSIRMWARYYADPERRAEARALWSGLQQAAAIGDAERGAALMQADMDVAAHYWPVIGTGDWPDDEGDPDDGDWD